jgi:glycine/D-amino acid oxidase-like deaminating enzyme
MKSRTKVVVIGGGIAGCSTLYHLTQEGWTDVVLIERNELTSGTTWHSAAQVTNFGMNQTMVGLTACQLSKPTSSITHFSIMDQPAAPDGSFCAKARNSMSSFDLH